MDGDNLTVASLDVTAEDVWAAFDEAAEMAPMDDDLAHKTVGELADHWRCSRDVARHRVDRAVERGAMARRAVRRNINGRLLRVMVYWPTGT